MIERSLIARSVRSRPGIGPKNRDPKRTEPGNNSVALNCGTVYLRKRQNRHFGGDKNSGLMQQILGSIIWVLKWYFLGDLGINRDFGGNFLG